LNGFPLSKSPEGLLGTLDLKNLGKNPQQLGDTLAPSIDCTEFYLLRNRLAINGAGAFVAVGTGIVLASGSQPMYFNAAGQFFVPQAETIRVKQLTLLNIRAAADAALTLELGVYLRRVITNNTILLGTAVFGARPATDLTGGQQVPLTEPLWLAPGDRLHVVPHTTQTAAGSNIVLGLDVNTVPSG
jgi:hypothetical protein